MCRPVPCNVCGRTTWAGCGDHVAQVRAIVPADQWCGGEHSAEEVAASNSANSRALGLFRR